MQFDLPYQNFCESISFSIGFDLVADLADKCDSFLWIFEFFQNTLGQLNQVQRVQLVLEVRYKAVVKCHQVVLFLHNIMIY